MRSLLQGTGQIQDAEAGLYFYCAASLWDNARYYDPVIGRFIQADTIVPEPGNPQTFNRYGYAYNNPVRYTDPTGHWVESAWDVANVAMGVGSLGYNLYQGNWGDAALDGAGLVLDVGATIVPVVPGGASTAIKAWRGAKSVHTAVDVLQYSDEAVDEAIREATYWLQELKPLVTGHPGIKRGIEMDQSQASSLLQQIKLRIRLTHEDYDRKMWKQMHDLAEAQYEPALPVFLTCAENRDLPWILRQDCLRCLGFHYPLEASGDVLQRVRKLVLDDPRWEIRLTAAAVLGSKSQWPDPTLQKVMLADEDEDVRRVAYGALLHLAEIPGDVVYYEKERVELGEITPTIAEINRVLKENGSPLVLAEEEE